MITARPELVRIPFSSLTAGSSPADTVSISGCLYGRTPEKAVIFSNMDTNCPDTWDPVVAELIPEGYMILTYEYCRNPEDQPDDLKDAVSFIRARGAEKIILIGASRGGVASVMAASDAEVNGGIVAIAAISAPRVYEGTVFYSLEELSRIKIPKLLINSEDDDWAGDTREMYDIFSGPKDLQFYPGDAHGTDILEHNRDALVQRIAGFVKAVFEG